jgi:hypothetical protein
VDTTVNLVRNGVKIKREDNCELLPEFPVDGAHWFIRGLSVLKDIQATRDPEIEARLVQRFYPLIVSLTSPFAVG